MYKVYVVAFLVLLPTLAMATSNRLTWTDNSNNETVFNIERKPAGCPNSGTFVEIATVGANITTFDDVNVSEGATYCYRVAASNAVGKSAYSNMADRAVPFTVPAAPSGLGVGGGP